MHFHKFRGSKKLAFGSLVILSLTSCSGEQSSPLTSLYDRLGGRAAITLVIDHFVANVAADTRINGYFQHTDIPHLKQQLIDQVCEVTGGPCKYTGRDMRTTHRGMQIQEAHFNALVEDLVKSLDSLQVKKAEQDELLTQLGAMKKDIIGQ